MAAFRNEGEQLAARVFIAVVVEDQLGNQCVVIIEEGQGIAQCQPARQQKGVLHGGVVATALDETMAWTAMLLMDSLVVTAKLELRYRKPALPGHPLRFTGRIVEQRGRRLVLAGSAADRDGIVAEAEGLFLASGDLPS